jgi:acyl-CoA thioesterase
MGSVEGVDGTVAAVVTKFERDTTVTRVDDDAYEASIDEGWFVFRGPNGGYVAALVLRAMTERVGDPARAPRSLTLHYVSPADVGPVRVTTSVERVGRSLTSCSARLHQGDRLVALAMAAFSAPRPGPVFCDLEMPDVAPPDAIDPVAIHPDAPAIAHRWDTRWAIGDKPWQDAPPAREAVAGGWIRLEEPQVLDACAVAAITDAWVPPLFSRMREPIVLPTIDLTVHFRVSLPLSDATPDDYLLAVFRNTAANEGFVEESGEVWSKTGTLVAQSRQLAAVTAASDGRSSAQLRMPS